MKLKATIFLERFKSKPYANLFILVLFISFVIGLLLPYAYALTFRQNPLANTSIPSSIIGSRFDTTWLGYQTFFGWLNISVVVVLGYLWLLKPKTVQSLLLTFLVIYILLVLISKFLNVLTGVGGPYGHQFLYGHVIMLVSTFGLFLSLYMINIVKKP